MLDLTLSLVTDGGQVLDHALLLANAEVTFADALAALLTSQLLLVTL